MKRFTTAVGNDATRLVARRRHIVFASSRMGFKTRVPILTLSCTASFVMRADGTGVEQLTDNHGKKDAGLAPALLTSALRSTVARSLTTRSS